MEEEKLNELKKEVDELEEKINYKYNEEGELRNKETNEKVKRLNKKEYSSVADYITKYIQYKILKEYKLIPMYVPSIENSSNFYIRIKDIPQCQIYVSDDFEINSKCICIIQGTGTVRVGLWARSVCINANLYLGSIIPYIKKAFENNFSLIVLNPNENCDIDDNKKKIPEFQTMESHCNYVYEHIIKKNNNIKNLYIIAHSMGGYCTIQILVKNEEDLLSGKIKKIVFTDSVHGDSYKELSEKGQQKLKDITKDYISSTDPLGQLISKWNKSNNGVNCYSSGHPLHEYTSGYAISEAFKWINSEDTCINDEIIENNNEVDLKNENIENKENKENLENKENIENKENLENKENIENKENLENKENKENKEKEKIINNDENKEEKEQTNDVDMNDGNNENNEGENNKKEDKNELKKEENIIEMKEEEKKNQ